MCKKRNIEKIIYNIYVDLFKHATPSADFNKLVANAKITENGEREIPFMDYEISMKATKDIIYKHTKYLRKHIQRKIANTIHLGCSPKFKRK